LVTQKTSIKEAAEQLHKSGSSYGVAPLELNRLTIYQLPSFHSSGVWFSCL